MAELQRLQECAYHAGRNNLIAIVSLTERMVIVKPP